MLRLQLSRVKRRVFPSFVVCREDAFNWHAVKLCSLFSHNVLFLQCEKKKKRNITKKISCDLSTILRTKHGKNGPKKMHQIFHKQTENRSVDNGDTEWTSSKQFNSHCLNNIFVHRNFSEFFLCFCRRQFLWCFTVFVPMKGHKNRQ